MFKKIVSILSRLIKPNQNVSHKPESELSNTEIEMMQKGAVFFQGKKYTNALRIYQSIIDDNPCCGMAYMNQGSTFEMLQKFEQAREAFLMAIALEPKNPEPCYKFALFLERQEKWDAALNMYQSALKLSPNDPNFLYCIGRVHMSLEKNLADAETAFLRALQINPEFLEVQNNLSALYINAGKFDEAIQLLEKVIKTREVPPAYINLVVAYCQQDEMQKAGFYFEKLLTLDSRNIKPDEAKWHEAKWNYGLCLLKSGDYTQGWKYYESRLKLTNHQNIRLISDLVKKFRKLERGESVSGKRILLFSEQGLGDAIQFVRFAKLLVQQNATVIILCQKELVRILSSVEGLSYVCASANESLKVDRIASLMSLPFLLNSTLETMPVETAYVKADQNKINEWKIILGEKKQYRVGLVWAGNTRTAMTVGRYTDMQRNMTLAQFNPLANISGIEWFSLQKGQATEQIKSSIWNLKLRDYTEKFHDLSDTAAFITQLDLVITVDSAVAHLSAALGKPTWVLNRFAGCWRWLQHREDSPWYPTIRLFRQKQRGDWRPVIEEVVQALHTLQHDEIITEAAASAAAPLL